MSTEQEALRLAGLLDNWIDTYPQASEDEPGGYASAFDQVLGDTQAMLRKLVAEREEYRAAMREALEALSISHDWIIESGTPAEVYGPVAERYAHAMHTNETATTDLRQRLGETT